MVLLKFLCAQPVQKVVEDLHSWSFTDQLQSVVGTSLRGNPSEGMRNDGPLLQINLKSNSIRETLLRIKTV
jgi:hypothetical protein